MSNTGTIDYDALAQQHGAIAGNVDYDSLAQQHGAIGMPAPAAPPCGCWASP